MTETQRDYLRPWSTARSRFRQRARGRHRPEASNTTCTYDLPYQTNLLTSTASYLTHTATSTFQQHTTSTTTTTKTATTASNASTASFDTFTHRPPPIHHLRTASCLPLRASSLSRWSQATTSLSSPVIPRSSTAITAHLNACHMLTVLTERKVAERSMLIKNMIEDLGSPGEEPIPIMNVGH